MSFKESRIGIGRRYVYVVIGDCAILVWSHFVKTTFPIILCDCACMLKNDETC